MTKLELLMPAGDFEKMKFAFAYGADAVYVGAPMFSLRARTNGFTMELLQEAVEYAHNLGKKIYFTTNIYAHNQKIKPFMAQFKKMYEMNPDAFIMSDPGLIYLVKKDFPNAVIHLSVQANNTNWAQAMFWKNLGISRIILSREISIKEIAEIHEAVPEIELEAFVHGAICMAYSGRCLISNYLSSRDPNQGTCSHSCRWSYKVFKSELGEAELENATGRPENYKELTGNYFLEEAQKPGELMEIDEDEYGSYLMNSRDLMAIDYIKELRDAGIISFKIEGRNKTINYVASTGLAYKEAILAVENNKEYDSKKLSEELFSIANRGYTPGFLAGNLGVNSQYYEKNGGFQTKVFCGIIRGYDLDNNLARIEVKNRFDLGDNIEILTPDGVYNSKVEVIKKILTANNSNTKREGLKPDIYDENLCSDEKSAHGGGYEVWINIEKDFGEFVIIRKNI